jgi:hypothetical protein
MKTLKILNHKIIFLNIKSRGLDENLTFESLQNVKGCTIEDQNNKYLVSILSNYEIFTSILKRGYNFSHSVT